MKTSLFPGIPKAIRMVLQQSNRAFSRAQLAAPLPANGTSHRPATAANSLDETGRLLPGLIHAVRV